MTDPVVPENPRRTELIATGGQDTFQFDFPGVAQASDLRVYQDGDLTTDFVLTAATKTIVLDTPAEGGDSIVIEGLKKIERKNEYPRSGNLQTRTLNPEINSIFEMIQELRRDVDRAITFNKSAIDTNNALPVFPEPGRALITGANGIEIADQNIGDFDEAIAAAAQHADEAAQAAAATELDAAIAEAAKSGAESARDAAQAAAAGMKWRNSVRAVILVNDTLSGLGARNGVTPVAGDRWLAAGQSTAAQNGVYIAAAGAWSRATDADTWSELVSQVVVTEEGTTNSDTPYICTVNPGGTLGSTAVTWVVLPVPIADASITLAKLDASLQTAIGKANTALQAADLDKTYLLRDEKASGTAGGTSVATTWTKHTLADKSNNISGASSASSVVTLPAGKYKVSGYVMGYQCGGLKCRLRNTTDSSTVITGSNGYTSGSNNDNCESFFDEFIFSIASTKTFELQYYAALALATNGLGIAATSGEVEVYAELRIEKIG